MPSGAETKVTGRTVEARDVHSRWLMTDAEGALTFSTDEAPTVPRQLTELPREAIPAKNRKTRPPKPPPPLPAGAAPAPRALVPEAPPNTGDRVTLPAPWSLEKPVRALEMPPSSVPPVSALPLVIVEAQEPAQVPEPAPPAPVVSAPAPSPAPAVAPTADDTFNLDAVIPGRRRSKPRWKLRIFAVAAINIGLLYLSGALHVPHNLGDAGAMVRGAVRRITAKPNPTAASLAAPASVAAAAPSEETHAATPAPAPTQAIPEGMGRLVTADAPPNRRLFVNEQIVGQTPGSVLVKCGAASVKIGSAGQSRRVEIPCGGELRLDGL